MLYIIYGTAFLIVFSKVLDGHSTIKQIQGVDHEKNVAARLLMHKIGIQATIYLFIGITFVITAICLYYVLYLFPFPIFQWSFVILGLLISIIQFAVAHANYRSKQNAITSLLQRTLFWLRN
jgi:4-hydroxybenzoate polyprenyltransferase